MGFADFFFSREGRFARVHWWASLLLWGTAVTLLSRIIVTVLAIQPQDCATRQTANSSSTVCITTWRLIVPVVAVVVLVSLAPMIKRLHDRGRSSHWAYVYLAAVFGPIVAVTLAGPQVLLDASPTLVLVLKAGLGLVGLTTLATIVDLGILRGTRGPNAHGEEPKHFSNLRG